MTRDHKTFFIFTVLYEYGAGFPVISLLGRILGNNCGASVYRPGGCVAGALLYQVHRGNLRLAHLTHLYHRGVYKDQ